MAASSSHRPREVLFVGTLPPPVTGMTMLTERVVRALQQSGFVCLFNWSNGLSRKGLTFRVSRVLRVLQTYYWLLRRGRRPDEPMYLVANSGWGLYITERFVVSAVRLGYRVHLHHHVYSYIDRHDARMARIDLALREQGAHIVHCEKMIEDFRRQYQTPAEFEIVYPSVVGSTLSTPRMDRKNPFQLGHLSNLTIEKGLDTVIATFERLIDRGYDARLTLAGPVKPGSAERLLRHALAKHPRRIEYHGPLYGKAKADFFSSVDAFLFPTKYRNESWGIVLYEALACGVPAITYDRGCTQTVVGASGGLVVPSSADYVGPAADQIGIWIDDEIAYRRASQGAIEQATKLAQLGETSLAAFVRQIFDGKNGFHE